MLHDIATAQLAQVKQRATEGDCPVTPALSVESLEDLVIHFAAPTSPAPACPTCGGRGEVGYFAGRHTDCPGWETERCDDCNGTGKAAPSPATDGDVTAPLARVDYPDGEWMPRMWDLALASSDDERVGSALTLKAVAASHGYKATWVRQETPDEMESAGHREILAGVAPPTDAPVDGTLVGRVVDEDGILNWYVRPMDGAAPVAQLPADPCSGLARDYEAMLKRMHDAPTMQAGYDILKDWAWQCGHGVPVALREPQPADAVGEVVEAATDGLIRFGDGLPVSDDMGRKLIALGMIETIEADGEGYQVCELTALGTKVYAALRSRQSGEASNG